MFNSTLSDTCLIQCSKVLKVAGVVTETWNVQVMSTLIF